MQIFVKTSTGFSTAAQHQDIGTYARLLVLLWESMLVEHAHLRRLKHLSLVQPVLVLRQSAIMKGQGSHDSYQKRASNKKAAQEAAENAYVPYSLLELSSIKLCQRIC